MKPELQAFERLTDIIEELRQKCPWDKVQTFESLRYLTIEEVYELSDTIVEDQPEEMKKELGDLFMHLVFYSSIAKEKGLFDISDAINGVCEKLIFRHPHIYGSGEERQNPPSWEEIKMAEGRKSVLDGVPNSLPAMIKALRMQEKAAGIGFNWKNSSLAHDKVMEEYREVQEELHKTDNQDRIEEEFGDLFFALIGWARILGVNPENALEKTNRKFRQRFQKMERDADRTISELGTDELLELWNKAKNETK